MKLTNQQIEEIEAGAEKIGDFGKVTISVAGPVVDIVTEKRVRFRNGKQDTSGTETRR
jgi:hypothetical protein